MKQWTKAANGRKCEVWAHVCKGGEVVTIERAAIRGGFGSMWAGVILRKLNGAGEVEVFECGRVYSTDKAARAAVSFREGVHMARGLAAAHKVEW